MSLMRPEDYPAQEPISAFAKPYHDETLRRAQGVAGVTVAYGQDPYQTIALFVPKTANGTVLAFIHGGGWTNGYKEWMAFMAPAFTAQGIVFASIGYRLAPMHLYPAGYDDCADAVAWLYKNIARHGGDPKRLFVGGHSAGGHYAALLTVRRDWQERRALPGNVIRGCLPVSGVYDFSAQGGLTQRPRFLGPEAQANDVPASPIHNVAGKTAPFLIAYGEKDFPHLMRQADEMEAALRKVGSEAEHLVLAGCDHLGASLANGDPSGPWARRALAWLASH